MELEAVAVKGEILLKDCGDHVLLFLSFVLASPQWWQSLVFLPRIEPRLLLALESACAGTADELRFVATQGSL